MDERSERKVLRPWNGVKESAISNLAESVNRLANAHEKTRVSDCLGEIERQVQRIRAYNDARATGFFVGKYYNGDVPHYLIFGDIERELIDDMLFDSVTRNAIADFMVHYGKVYGVDCGLVGKIHIKEISYYEYLDWLELQTVDIKYKDVIVKQVRCGMFDPLSPEHVSAFSRRAALMNELKIPSKSYSVSIINIPVVLEVMVDVQP